MPYTGLYLLSSFMIPAETRSSKLSGSVFTSSYHNQLYLLYILILILPRIKKEKKPSTKDFIPFIDTKLKLKSKLFILQFRNAMQVA